MWRIPKTRNPKQIVQANRKKWFYTSCLTKNEEIGGIFELIRLRTLNSFQKFKIKIKKFRKTIPVDILSLGVSNGTTFMQVYLSGGTFKYIFWDVQPTKSAGAIPIKIEHISSTFFLNFSLLRDGYEQAKYVTMCCVLCTKSTLWVTGTV